MSIKILAVAGSLRKASTNKGLLRAAISLAPKELSFDVFDIKGIPLYDGDVEAKDGFPAEVVDFRKRIRAADALLIAAPEYNFGLPGVLKNAIDWASRPTKDEPVHPFNQKPLGLISAAAGRFGGGRSQFNMRQVAVFLNIHVMNSPEMLINANYEKFDMETGELKDETSKKFLKAYMESFAKFAKHMRTIGSA